MAETMQDIRRRMATVESTQHITHAMRLVSAAKFRRAKKQYDRIGLQLEKTIQVMEQMLRQSAEYPAGNQGRHIIIVITSSRGLCGAYNSSLIKAAAGVSSPGDIFCAVGSRGEDFFGRQGYEMLYRFDAGPEKIKPQDAAEMVRRILNVWQEGKVSGVSLVSMGYVNALKQEPRVRQLLPTDIPSSDGVRELPADLEFHPSEGEVQAWLLPKYLELILWKAAAEAAVCEHVARRAAMEAAADSAGDMLAELSRSFHRIRQQVITDELIEIVSGAESLK